jgi:hypothetical protein
VPVPGGGTVGAARSFEKTPSASAPKFFPETGFEFFAGSGLAHH